VVVETMTISSRTAFSQTKTGAVTVRNLAATSAEVTVEEIATRTLRVASADVEDAAALTVTV
jgi:hypothetical protein